MLRTNLATRPFYNTRVVQAVLGVLVIVVALLTILNVVQLVRLNLSERELGARAGEAEVEAARLRADAQRIRGQIDTAELAQVATAAEEANAIIDQRAFSWTELMVRLEETLPESVRMTRLQPRIDDDGRFVLSVRVRARRVPDLEMFLDALEQTNVFHEVLATEERVAQDGLVDALVEGVYEPVMRARDASVPAGGPAAEETSGE